ncbi:hypothetical protein [Candidatus Protochlamydia amoebophila]|uniref:Uncharacterized protein n=1 Tax=Candidatus Protochlamydia amoebophila TaxID=362787 RepID=A0A0C1H7U8_9BACT|nr:hypothetical protein [Candidatus Protochlamydia amoebophila]KIC70968.1 hypothetical protein DB44_FE00190 [Candidatus Protochlamydia amoebophila]
MIITDKNIVSNAFTDLYTKKCKRGQEAVTEMLNRQSIVNKADEFFCKEMGNEEEQRFYFIKKIEQYKHTLPQPALKKDYKGLAHKVFAIYRSELVEKACQQINTNPLDWTFTAETWKQQRKTFQDFMWVYAKMVYSGSSSSAIAFAMKQHFPCLPQTFCPGINAVIVSNEQEYYCPNS